MPRLADALKIQNVFTAAAYAAGTYYNGVEDASGLGIDTRDYEDCLIVLNCGATSTNGTLDVTILGTNDNTEDASDATVIYDGVFEQITTDNDNTLYVGSIENRLLPRFLIVKATVANQNCTFGVSLILGNADEMPAGQSLQFDVSRLSVSSSSMFVSESSESVSVSESVSSESSESSEFIE